MTYVIYTENLDQEQHEEFDQMLLGQTDTKKTAEPVVRQSRNTNALMATMGMQQGRRK